MAIHHLKYAALLCFIHCVYAQYGYGQLSLRNGGHFLSPFQRPSFIQQPYRRTDSCSQYPGSTCMFVLLCLMSGGMPAGTCPGNFLSTCCIPPTSVTQTLPPATLPKAITPASLPQTVPPPKTTHRWTAIRNTPVEQSIETNKQTDHRWTSIRNTVVKQSVETTKPEITTVSSYTEKPIKSHNVTFCGVIKAKPQSRIIGGNDAMYGEFPWQAHIKLKRQQCGGVLLNRYYILTAAHCIYQIRLKDIVIQLGVYDIQDHTHQENPPQVFTVVEKKVHPKFQYQAAHPDRFDVALLKLDRAVRYQDNVVPICLPRKDANFLGWKGYITGWGKTDTGLGTRFGTRLLQKVDVPIISNRQCEKWHEEKEIDITISPEMMCAGYEEGQKDACVGDSGGPLIVPVQGRWVVAGLVSAGFGCAQSKQPGIYHRVTHTVDWIRENITS